MTMVIETIFLCVLFTIGVLIMAKEPIKTLYNYPPKIQERVKSLDEYKDKIPTNKNKIAAKLTASVVIIAVVSIIMRYVNGYTTFMDAFLNSFIIWTIVNFYDAFIIDCLWFCHDKKFVFKGTEDMVDEYHNYWFHIKGSLIGEIIGLIVCIIVGIIVSII